jgi:RND family efflux transporter MFP subunit
MFTAACQKAPLGDREMMIHAGDKFGAINRLLHTRRLLPLFLTANVVLLLCAVCIPTAEAQLSVSVTNAKLEAGYQVDRVYGGEVRAGRVSTLGFRHAGEIARVHVQEGDTVGAGQLLAELDPEPLQAVREQAAAGYRHAEANLKVARAAVELATATTRRHRELLDQGHTSAQRFDEVRLDLAAKDAQLAVATAELSRARASLRAADVDLERSRIHAPYAARIQTRHADEGAILVPGQAVLRIVEADRREARIGLPPAVAATLAPGRTYPFRSGDRLLEGTLLQVLPEVDGRTRTLTALFALEANGSPAAAGSLIELNLERTITEPGFWLPLSALSEAQRGLWSLFVVIRDNSGETIERRLVEVTPETSIEAWLSRPPARTSRTGTAGTALLIHGLGGRHTGVARDRRPIGLEAVAHDQNVIPPTHGVLIDRPRVKHDLRVNAWGLAGGGAVEVPDRQISSRLDFLSDSSSLAAEVLPGATNPYVFCLNGIALGKLHESLKDLVG